jgi:5-methylcytosine-specific restriction endonuclease McrA
MIAKKCEICGKEYFVKPYREKTARFCSFKCSGYWHLKNREMPNEHKKGNKWRKGLRPTNSFTSEQAEIFNRVESEYFICKNCGNTFQIKPWIVRQNRTKSGLRFCTKQCHSEYMKKEKSGEKSSFYVGGITTYRGRGWIISRREAVKRDKGICQRCGKYIGDSIPVHHIKPYRLFNSVKEANNIDNLISLCQSCHMKYENENE